MPLPEPMLAPGAGWTADQIPSGAPFELSDGQLIEVMPTKRGGASAQRLGASVVGSDPAVKRVGVEAGVSTHPGQLRAPDVAVLSEEGSDDDWERTAPPLAIEYAGPGQDWTDLKKKIDELLRAGTKHLWVVRMDGPRRVEVYEPGRPKVTRIGGELLEAPGVLANPVPVEALYSAEAADGVILRNLLQRFGYQDIEAVRDEAHEEGRQEGQQQGLQQGLQQGQQQGQLQALREATTRQLQRRFPTEADAIPALLEGRGPEALMALLDAMWDAPDLASLRGETR